MYLTRLFYRGLFYQFSFDYADKHRKELNVYGSVENFIKKFTISPGLEEEFVTFASESGIPRDNEGLSASREIIQSRIKAGIARNIWGNEGYYPFLNEIDRTVEEAVRVLDSSAQFSQATSLK
ncbi:hypothetical protein KFE98_08725 [bacterium SCSIO 12741]|nr:hypothetical protein KFE98_08725 [bacterium SCSIO 12741]